MNNPRKEPYFVPQNQQIPSCTVIQGAKKISVQNTNINQDASANNTQKKQRKSKKKPANRRNTKMYYRKLPTDRDTCIFVGYFPRISDEIIRELLLYMSTSRNVLASSTEDNWKFSKTVYDIGVVKGAVGKPDRYYFYFFFDSAQHAKNFHKWHRRFVLGDYSLFSAPSNFHPVWGVGSCILQLKQALENEDILDWLIQHGNVVAIDGRPPNCFIHLNNEEDLRNTLKITDEAGFKLHRVGPSLTPNFVETTLHVADIAFLCSCRDPLVRWRENFRVAVNFRLKYIMSVLAVDIELNDTIKYAKEPCGSITLFARNTAILSLTAPVNSSDSCIKTLESIQRFFQTHPIIYDMFEFEVPTDEIDDQQIVDFLRLCIPQFLPKGSFIWVDANRKRVLQMVQCDRISPTMSAESRLKRENKESISSVSEYFSKNNIAMTNAQSFISPTQLPSDAKSEIAHSLMDMVDAKSDEEEVELDLSTSMLQLSQSSQTMSYTDIINSSMLSAESTITNIPKLPHFHAQMIDGAYFMEMLDELLVDKDSLRLNWITILCFEKFDHIQKMWLNDKNKGSTATWNISLMGTTMKCSRYRNLCIVLDVRPIKDMLSFLIKNLTVGYSIPLGKDHSSLDFRFNTPPNVIYKYNKKQSLVNVSGPFGPTTQFASRLISYLNRTEFRCVAKLLPLNPAHDAHPDQIIQFIKHSSPSVEIKFIYSENKEKMREIIEDEFFDFDPGKICNTSSEDFMSGYFHIKCSPQRAEQIIKYIKTTTAVTKRSLVLPTFTQHQLNLCHMTDYLLSISRFCRKKGIPLEFSFSNMKVSITILASDMCLLKNKFRKYLCFTIYDRFFYKKYIDHIRDIANRYKVSVSEESLCMDEPIVCHGILDSYQFYHLQTSIRDLYDKYCANIVKDESFAFISPKSSTIPLMTNFFQNENDCIVNMDRLPFFDFQIHDSFRITIKHIDPLIPKENEIIIMSASSFLQYKKRFEMFVNMDDETSTMLKAFFRESDANDIYNMMMTTMSHTTGVKPWNWQPITTLNNTHYDSTMVLSFENDKVRCVPFEEYNSISHSFLMNGTRLKREEGCELNQPGKIVIFSRNPSIYPLNDLYSKALPSTYKLGFFFASNVIPDERDRFLTFQGTEDFQKLLFNFSIETVDLFTSFDGLYDLHATCDEIFQLKHSFCWSIPALPSCIMSHRSGIHQYCLFVDNGKAEEQFKMFESYINPRSNPFPSNYNQTDPSMTSINEESGETISSEMHMNTPWENQEWYDRLRKVQLLLDDNFFKRSLYWVKSSHAVYVAQEAQGVLSRIYACRQQQCARIAAGTHERYMYLSLRNLSDYEHFKSSGLFSQMPLQLHSDISTAVEFCKPVTISEKTGYLVVVVATHVVGNKTSFVPGMTLPKYLVFLNIDSFVQNNTKDNVKLRYDCDSTQNPYQFFPASEEKHEKAKKSKEKTFFKKQISISQVVGKKLPAWIDTQPLDKMEPVVMNAMKMDVSSSDMSKSHSNSSFSTMGSYEFDFHENKQNKLFTTASTSPVQSNLMLKSLLKPESHFQSFLLDSAIDASNEISSMYEGNDTVHLNNVQRTTLDALLKRRAEETFKSESESSMDYDNDMNSHIQQLDQTIENVISLCSERSEMNE
ncbi:hypothetical protein PCE1_003041 [Barthelona sp. PCE]